MDLARRAWQAVRVDAVPKAVDEARRGDTAGARFVVGGVTDLRATDLGMFDSSWTSAAFKLWVRASASPKGAQSPQSLTPAQRC